jgi:hypothetical protein
MRGFGGWVWGLIGGLLCFLLEGELRALFLRASEGLVRRASLKIPAQVRERILGDWLADIESLGQEGRYFSQLGHAYQFYRNAWEIAWAAAQELPKIDQLELAVEYTRWCSRWLKTLFAFSIPIMVLSNVDLWLWDIPGFTISLTFAGMLAAISSLQFYLELGRALKETRFGIAELKAYIAESKEVRMMIEARKTTLDSIGKPAIQ